MAQTIDDPPRPPRFPRISTTRRSAPRPGSRDPPAARRPSTWSGPTASAPPCTSSGGRADLVTTAEGEPVVVGEAEMLVTIGANRTVESVETVPHRDGIDQLVGTQGGSYLRSAIETALPGEREAATPLHLLLDDIAGTSLIGGLRLVALAARGDAEHEPADARGVRAAQGTHHLLGATPRRLGADRARARRGPGVTRSGSPATSRWPTIRSRGTSSPSVLRCACAVIVGSTSDPRDDTLFIDAFFRDSCWEPDGTEMALHEYTVVSEVDAATHTLRAVRATPHVLPFPECQWAAPHVDQLVGMPVDGFRTSVQETLTELQCCTHLNDMLRCLAEVPALAAALAQAS